MQSRNFKYDINSFCYICGHYVKNRVRKHYIMNSPKLCKAYQEYFGIPIGDQDKLWSPYVACDLCNKTLLGWLRGKNRKMKFGIPRIWREPTDHHSNCYFCMVDVPKLKGKNSGKYVYPNIPSSMVSVEHGPDIPVPKILSEKADVDINDGETNSSTDTSYSAEKDNKPYFPCQNDINDLIRDLNSNKSNAELLTSRLKQWNLLDDSVRISHQRKRGLVRDSDSIYERKSQKSSHF